MALPIINNAATMTRPGPYAGHVVKYDANGPLSCTFRNRTLVQQVSSAALTDGFNGARELGFVLDGAIITFDNAANVAAWVTGINAVLALNGVQKGTITYSAPNVIFTATDGLPHTLGLYNPASPDLVLAAWSLTTANVQIPAVGPGRAVFWLDPTFRTVEAALPASTLLLFAGVVDLNSIQPPELTTAYATESFTLISGQNVRVNRKGTICLQNGAAVTKKQPVYAGRLAAEAGNFYGADDIGNTRLLIPDAMWLSSGSYVAGYGTQAVLF